MTDQNKPEDAISEDETPQAPVEPVEDSTAPTAGGPTEGGTELPYVDDPISKWWIAIIVAVFALIFAFAILLGTNGLLGDIFSGDDDATPEPTLIASPSASAEASAEPTLEPSAEPSIAPTSEPTAEPTLEPTAEPTAEPTPEPTAEPTATPSAEASIGPCPTSLPDMSPDPMASGAPSLAPCFTPEPSLSPLPSITPLG
jgi:hypothetical protein